MSITLDEAIRHAMNIAEKQEELAEVCVVEQARDSCLKCAEEHRQLAEWLNELAERRKLPEIVHCEDCKHYKIDHPRANGYHCCYRCHNIFPMKEDDFCSRAEKRHVENG